MLIIVEGPDNSGKSTLVEKIKAGTPPRAGQRFVSMLGGRTEPPDAVRERTYSALNSLCDYPATLCERFHPVSDEVYRTLYGGRRIFSRHEFESICRTLYLERARVIYCRPPLSVAMETALQKKGDDTPEWVEEVQRTLPQLYDAYDDLMNRLAWVHDVAVVRHDRSNPLTSALVEALACAD